LTAFAIFPALHQKSQHGEFHGWMSGLDRARIAANMAGFSIDRMLPMFRETVAPN
jgi:hypothetical protein